MLECRLVSRLGLDYVAFSEACHQGFSWVLQFSPLLNWLVVSADEIKRI